MADNTTLNAGSGGDVVGSDDISGVKYQRIKLIYGGDGVNSGDVSLTNPLPVAITTGEYETVAASQTAQALGATGAAGDFIAGILVVPATTSPGAVALLDNATSITVFTGGASSVSNLVPFYIPLNMVSVNGPWKITTGASVSCIGIGNFT